LTIAISPLHVVQLTPPGRGAIATILVEGPGAVDLIETMERTRFGRPLSDFPDDRLVVGRFAEENGEEIVIRRRGPKTVELHCHGGYAAAAMIEETLRQKGCRVIAWQEWTAKVQKDPIAAAAKLALAEATTQRTAAILLDQYNGALGRTFETIQQNIDEKNFTAARQHVDSLLSLVTLGAHLTKPWRVVVAGPPNAGKSTLINALVGFERSIVHHTPGTTRDAVTVTTAMDGWPVELCDTAGLHAKAEGIEKAGMELARQKIGEADLTVLVFDLSKKWSRADQSLAESYSNAMLVHNKIDIAGPDFGSKDDRPEGLFISALSGMGIEKLVGTIAKQLVPVPPSPGAAVPFTMEQIERVQGFARSLQKTV
jgi:tRNA modification GTPase